jgi:hypothetical protein
MQIDKELAAEHAGVAGMLECSPGLHEGDRDDAGMAWRRGEAWLGASAMRAAPGR